MQSNTDIQIHENRILVTATYPDEIGDDNG